MKHTLGDKDIKALAKLVVDPKTDKVLGVHMVGAEAAEIVQVRSSLSMLWIEGVGWNHSSGKELIATLLGGRVIGMVKVREVCL